MPDAVASRLSYRFRQPDLLVQALTHRSHGARHNERLEFVGDAVLNCAIAVALFRRFPSTDEGELSRARATLVNRDTLAQLARSLALGASIRLGEGEQKTGGQERPSILADAMEAVFGAVFVDGGFDAACAVIESVYGGVLADADPASLGKDPKTRLQEWLQARRIPVPEYTVVEVGGEAHAQTFVVECKVASRQVAARGEGASRRAAEQAAAERTWLMLTRAGGQERP